MLPSSKPTFADVNNGLRPPVHVPYITLLLCENLHSYACSGIVTHESLGLDGRQPRGSEGLPCGCSPSGGIPAG